MEVGSTQAIAVVHWPGRDTPACADHLRRLVGLGAILGFAVTWTPCADDDETQCTNCASEAKKAEDTPYQVKP